jgi:hypothetical protein
MDTLTAGVAIVSLVVAHGGALLALWLRLHWRTRHVEIQGRYLVQLAQASAGRGQLSVDEQHGQAHRLTMTLTTSPGMDSAA